MSKIRNKIRNVLLTIADLLGFTKEYIVTEELIEKNGWQGQVEPGTVAYAVNGKGIVRDAAIILVTAVGVSGVLVANNLNNNLVAEAPSKDDLANIDQLGDGKQNNQGTTGAPYFEEEGKQNANNAQAQNPANSDKTLVEQLVNGTLTFEYENGNNVPTTLAYTFNSQEGTYLLTTTSKITLPNGVVTNTISVTNGKYVIENGLLQLLVKAGLNAGDEILGEASEDGWKHINSIYIDENGKICCASANGIIEGVSSVYTAPTQQAPIAPDTTGLYDPIIDRDGNVIAVFEKC